MSGAGGCRSGHRHRPRSGWCAEAGPALGLPVGVVLAGGLGRRIGGRKAVVEVSGRPLLAYVLDALRGALEEVVIVAKADTALPPSVPDGVTAWIEPDEPRHPVAGIVHALRCAGGRPVLVCACDLPLVTAELVRALAATDPVGRPAVVARREGALEPLLGLYAPAALEALAAFDATAPARALVGALDPVPFDVPDGELLLNVNAPEDVLHAAAALSRRSRTSNAPAARSPARSRGA